MGQEAKKSVGVAPVLFSDYWEDSKAVLPWARGFTSLCLSCLVYKVRMTSVLKASWGRVHELMMCKGFTIVPACGEHCINFYSSGSLLELVHSTLTRIL